MIGLSLSRRPKQNYIVRFLEQHSISQDGRIRMVNLGEDQNGLQFEQTLLRGDNVFKFHRNFLSLLKTQPEKQVTNKFAGKARTIPCPPPPS